MKFTNLESFKKKLSITVSLVDTCISIYFLTLLSRSYGNTCSLATRVSAAVLQKNIGYTYVNKVSEPILVSFY